MSVWSVAFSPSESPDVVELAEAAGDGAARQRRALQRRDDAAGIEHFAARRRAGRNHDHFELLFRQAKGLKAELTHGLQALELGGHRHAVDAFAGNDQETDRMHRHEAAGRQHGALHAFLPARLEPRAEIRDQVQFVERFGRLGPRSAASGPLAPPRCRSRRPAPVPKDASRRCRGATVSSASPASTDRPDSRLRL